MKRIVIGLVAGLLVCGTGFAAGIGDSADKFPKPMTFGFANIAMEDSYVFEKDLEKSGSYEGDIQKISNSYAKIKFSPVENFMLYGKLGFNDMELEVTDRNNGDTYDVNSKFGFLWGAGGAYQYDFSPRWRVGADVQFLS